MNNAPALIYVVDDDVSVRNGLDNLLRSEGFTVQTFSSAQELLASARSDVPTCLLLDVQLPGLSAVKIGFKRKLREVSSKKLNVMKSKSGWIQVSKRFDICRAARRNVDTFSGGRDFPAVEIFPTFNQFPRSQLKPNFGSLLRLLSRRKTARHLVRIASQRTALSSA